MKISDEQKKVLRAAAKGGGFICYYKGGFWSSPGQQTDERFGAPVDWHTTVQTIKAMERRGLLEKLETSANYSGFQGLEDRKVTVLGLSFLGAVVIGKAREGGA